MKKIFFIIIGGTIALASCNNAPKVDLVKQQAHIDSVVNDFVNSKKAELDKMCNDNIMAAAQDSAKMILEKEKAGMHHVWHKPAPVVKKDEPKKSPNVATGGLTSMSDKNNTGSVSNTGLTGKADNKQTPQSSVLKGGLTGKADHK
jgi:hypothetical protein